MSNYSVNPMDFYTLTTGANLSAPGVLDKVLYYITYMCQPNLVGEVFDAGDGKSGLRFAIRNEGLTYREDALVELLVGADLGLTEENTTLVKADRL